MKIFATHVGLWDASLPRTEDVGVLISEVRLFVFHEYRLKVCYNRILIIRSERARRVDTNRDKNRSTLVQFP